jgi:hypothetical protein
MFAFGMFQGIIDDAGLRVLCKAKMVLPVEKYHTLQFFSIQNMVSK